MYMKIFCAFGFWGFLVTGTTKITNKREKIKYSSHLNGKKSAIIHLILGYSQISLLTLLHSTAKTLQSFGHSECKRVNDHTGSN